MELTFGDRITLLRKKRKLSQQDLAEQLGVKGSDLEAWESDEDYPSFDLAIELADLLDISLDFLACRIEQQPNKEWVQMAAELDKLTDKDRDTMMYATKRCISGFQLIQQDRQEAAGKPAPPQRQGEQWTGQEDTQLKTAFRNGAQIARLAQSHQRTKGAIRSRLRKLELIE